MSFGRAPRRRFTLLAAPAAAAALALTLTACGGDGNKAAWWRQLPLRHRQWRDLHRGRGGPPGRAEARRGGAGRQALDVADYKGKVVVLNVWGSWCGPCRLEAKHFAKVSKETASQGVQFIGINTRDAEKGPAVNFEKDNGITYPSFFDPIGKLILRFPKGTLNPQAIPSTVVIDRDGKIAARTLVALDDVKLHKMIDPLIAEK